MSLVLPRAVDSVGNSKLPCLVNGFLSLVHIGFVFFQAPPFREGSLTYEVLVHVRGETYLYKDFFARHGMDIPTTKSMCQSGEKYGTVVR